MKLLLFLCLACLTLHSNGQKVDSIYFHLYTDSLKKGVHNYINVDGKLSNGQWKPLTTKEIDFSATHGRFDGNSLIIDTAFKGEKVTIRAVLKNDPKLWKEVTIYIKTVIPNERLKTVDEILNRKSPPAKRKKKGKSETPKSEI